MAITEVSTTRPALSNISIPNRHLPAIKPILTTQTAIRTLVIITAPLFMNLRNMNTQIMKKGENQASHVQSMRPNLNTPRRPEKAE